MPRAAVASASVPPGLAVNVAITTRVGRRICSSPWWWSPSCRGRSAGCCGPGPREQATSRAGRAARRGTGAAGTRIGARERARIARELHDVIAHSVSVMVIQAGGARMVMDTEPDRAEASLLQVERAGREALTELRRLVGSLNPADGAALAPQPRLADIGDLIASTRAAGLETDLRVEGDAITIPAALDLCAYRILQESLTNAMKHAGPARVSIRLCWLGDALELEVADDGRGRAERERAARARHRRHDRACGHARRNTPRWAPAPGRIRRPRPAPARRGRRMTASLCAGSAASTAPAWTRSQRSSSPWPSSSSCATRLRTAS